MAPPENFAAQPPTLLPLGKLHKGAVMLELCEDRVHHLLGRRNVDVDGGGAGAGPDDAPFRVVDDQLVVFGCPMRPEERKFGKIDTQCKEGKLSTSTEEGRRIAPQGVWEHKPAVVGEERRGGEHAIVPVAAAAKHR